MNNTAVFAGSKRREIITYLIEFTYFVLLGLCDTKSGVGFFSVCVMIGIGKPKLWQFLGAMCSGVATANGNYIYVGVLMGVFGVLWLFDKKQKPVNDFHKLIISVVCAALIALGVYKSGGSIFENPLRCVISFCSIPLLVYGVSGAFAKTARGRRKELGVLTVAFLWVKGASVIEIGGFLPSVALASFLTLWLGSGSVGFGGCLGFVLGCACGIEYMPVMGILGFCSAMLWDSNKAFGTWFSYLVSSACGWYLLDTREAVIASILSLVGCAAYLLFHKQLAPFRSQSAVLPEKIGFVQSKISAAFSSLSGVFFAAGRESAVIEKTELCEKVKTSVSCMCRGCSGCGCDKNDLALFISDVIWEKGRMSEFDLPEHIQKNCKQRTKLIKSVNTAAAEQGKGLKNGLEKLAGEYLDFSRLVCSANEKHKEDSLPDRAKEKRVKELLRSKGVKFRSVSVFGTRKISVLVYGIVMETVRFSSKELQYMLSTLLLSKFEEPEFVFSENGATLKTQSLPALRVECAKMSVGKPGERVCGDTVSFFESDNGYFYSLISDGMGSGRKAELASRLASVFLEKLLTLGADATETLHSLNSMLISKGEEVFTTVDLLEVDRLTGKARLIKAGASPTFIYRNGKCYRLDACTAPVGIIDKVKAAETKTYLQKGDYIIMTSDGITPEDPAPCLPTSGEKKSAAYLANAIISAWGEKVTSSDDMSVSVVRIL